MRRGKWGLAAGLVVCCWLALAGTEHTVAGPAEEKIRADIEAAWKAREAKVRSARLSWVEKTTVPKGHVTDVVPQAMRERTLKQMGLPKDAVIPPEATTYDVPVTLLVEGRRLRIERKRRSWSVKNKAFMPDPYTDTFNGKLGKSLKPPWAETNYPQGLIREERRPEEASSVHNAPALMAVRPLAPGMRTWDLESMSISPERARIAGKACIELSRREGASLLRNWVCPDLGYNVVRRLTTNRDKVTLKLDISYREDPTLGWAPASWSLIWHTTSVRGALVEFTANPPVTDADFDIEFPPGAVVTDMTKRPATTFIVKRDGTKRPVSRQEEHTKTYDELLNSDPPGTPAWRWFSWPVLLALGAGALCLAVVVVRRVRRLRLAS